MARYTGPSYRKSRRYGFSTLETGKELTKKPYAPGQHGSKRGKKLSNYGVQLQEKQKVRFMYGLNEKQFKKTFEDAGKMKGVHGENFLILLLNVTAIGIVGHSVRRELFRNYFCLIADDCVEQQFEVQGRFLIFGLAEGEDGVALWSAFAV